MDIKKPHIVILSAGGTIASRVDYKIGGVSPAITGTELVAMVPELINHVYVKETKTITNMLSEDMSPKEWQAIAEQLTPYLEDDTIKGIVITHGTDTMHYTAAAISFMVKTNKPIVFVGSQRSSDRPSSDAYTNLVCAAYTAAYSDMAEVGICMHANTSDDYCYFIRGTKAKKMHTSRRDTFRPVNDLPLARVYPQGKIEIINKNYKKTSKARAIIRPSFEQKTTIIKAYPGADPEIIDHLVAKGYKGIVIEATGLGHVPTNSQNSWREAIQNAIKHNTIIAFTSQAQYGRLNPFVYSSGRIMHDLGVIYCEDMLTETAYVKLGWLLSTKTNTQEIKDAMTKNIAGEITERTLPETFLY